MSVIKFLILPAIVLASGAKHQSTLLEGMDGPLSDEQIQKAVNIVCSPDKYICPKPEYGSFQEVGVYSFNMDAVLGSRHSNVLRAGVLPNNVLAPFIRHHYCCMEGICLHRCGIKPIHEINLVRNFPSNVNLLFSLDFPGMEEFREPVFKYLEKTNWKPVGRPFPAEIEEYFDFLHEHRHAIVPLAQEAIIRARFSDVPDLFN